MQFTEIPKIILKNYNLGDKVLEFKPISGGIDIHSNYKLITNNSQFFVKVIESSSELERYNFIGKMQNYLVENGCKVPKVFPAKNGNLIQDNCLIYAFVSGEEKRVWTENEIKSVVSNLANIHQALENYPCPPFVLQDQSVYIRGQSFDYIKSIILPKLLELNLPKSILNSIHTAVESLGTIQFYYANLAKQIIHSDVNESNALFKDNSNAAIIDFALAFEPRVYDVAIFIYWWCFPWWEKDFYLDRYTHVIEQYQTMSRFTKEELLILPKLVVRRALLDVIIPIIRVLDDSNITLDIDNLTKKVERLNFVQNTLETMSLS